MVYTIRYKVGDTAPLSYRIEEWNEDTRSYDNYDLSGKTVYMNMKLDDAEDYSIYMATCTITSASEGLIEYEWNDGETATGGMYRLSFVVENTEGKIGRFPEYDTLWMLMYNDEVL